MERAGVSAEPRGLVYEVEVSGVESGSVSVFESSVVSEFKFDERGLSGDEKSDKIPQTAKSLHTTQERYVRYLEG